MRRLAFVLTLALAAPLFADPPKVPEPVKANVGDDIQIEVTVEAGKKGAYAPGFDVADCLFFRGYSEDETVMRFLARPKKAQKFVTVFWTVGEAKYSTLVIDAAPVAPPTPPVPPAPTPSDGLLGLTKASREGAAKVASATRAAQGPRLAQAHRTLAVTLSTAAPPYPAEPASLAAAVLDAKRAVNRSSGADPAAWTPWATSVDSAVQALYTAGKLKTVADWQEALTEIAQGLEN